MYQSPFRLLEASLGGAASTQQHQNPSIRNHPSLLYLNASVNSRPMQLMIDTGATRTFISKDRVNDMNQKRVINK